MNQEKREIARFKAVLQKLEEAFPLIKHDERERLANLVSNGQLLDEAAGKINKKLVFWPQQSADLAQEVLEEADLKKGLDVYNDYRALTKATLKDATVKDSELRFKPNTQVRLMQPPSGKEKYQIEDVLAADVKRFRKAGLAGVRFLAVTLKDGNKFRYILDDLRTIKAASSRAASKYDTYRPEA